MNDEKNCPDCYSKHLAVECPTLDCLQLTAGETRVVAGLLVMAARKVKRRMDRHPFKPEEGKRDVSQLKLETYATVYKKLTGEVLPV